MSRIFLYFETFVDVLFSFGSFNFQSSIWFHVLILCVAFIFIFDIGNKLRFFQWLIIDNRQKFDFNLRDSIDQCKVCKLSVEMGKNAIYVENLVCLAVVFCTTEFRAKLFRMFFFWCVIALVSFAIRRSHSLTLAICVTIIYNVNEFRMQFFVCFLARPHLVGI